MIDVLKEISGAVLFDEQILMKFLVSKNCVNLTRLQG